MSKILVHYKIKGKIDSLKEFQNSIKSMKIKKKIKRSFFENQNYFNCLVGKLDDLNYEQEILRINNLVLNSLYLEIIGNIYNYDELKKIIEFKYGILGKISKEEVKVRYKVFGYNFFEN